MGLERPVRDRPHLDPLDPGGGFDDLLAVRLVPALHREVADDDLPPVLDQVDGPEVAPGAPDGGRQAAQCTGDVLQIDAESERVTC